MLRLLRVQLTRGGCIYLHKLCSLHWLRLRCLRVVLQLLATSWTQLLRSPVRPLCQGLVSRCSEPQLSSRIRTATTSLNGGASVGQLRIRSFHLDMIDYHSMLSLAPVLDRKNRSLGALQVSLHLATKCRGIGRTARQCHAVHIACRRLSCPHGPKLLLL